MSQYGSVTHINGFRSEPSDKECLEAIWTQGKSCKDCHITCYRAGWSNQRASVDNKEMVYGHTRNI